MSGIITSAVMTAVSTSSVAFLEEELVFFPSETARFLCINFHHLSYLVLTSKSTSKALSNLSQMQNRGPQLVWPPTQPGAHSTFNILGSPDINLFCSQASCACRTMICHVLMVNEGLLNQLSSIPNRARVSKACSGNSSIGATLK